MTVDEICEGQTGSLSWLEGYSQLNAEKIVQKKNLQAGAVIDCEQLHPFGKSCKSRRLARD